MTEPEAQHGEAIITVKNIVNRFGKQTVHDHISFEVRPGEILGIAGDSGSGKSVLMKTMAGLKKPDSGKITIAGKPIGAITARESASLLSVLFQAGALFSALTVAENIMLPLREYTKLTEAQQMQLAELKLAMVGMEPASAAKYPAQLSGGMTSRAALARALAMDPKVLFLDEPTAALDPINASAFDELILNLNRSLQITVVMVSHDLNSLFTLCDRIAILVDKNVIIDTVENLLQHDHPWIQEFFHGPRGQGAAVAARSRNGK